MPKPVLAFSLLSLLVGCYATTTGMRSKREDPSAGVAKRYPGPCAEHFAVAKKAASEMSLEVLGEDAREGELLLRRGSRSLDGWPGDRIAVWFDTDGDGCRVRVYARGQNAFSAGGDDWPQRFFRRMKLIRDEQ